MRLFIKRHKGLIAKKTAVNFLIPTGPQGGGGGERDYLQKIWKDLCRSQKTRTVQNPYPFFIQFKSSPHYKKVHAAPQYKKVY